MKRKTQLFLAPAAILSVFALAACGGASAGEDDGGDGGSGGASGSSVSGGAGDYQVEGAKTFGTLNFGGSTATTVSFIVSGV